MKKSRTAWVAARQAKGKIRPRLTSPCPSRPRPFGNAAGCDIGIAVGLAALRGLAPIDMAGQSVDQPGAFFRGAFEADVTSPDRVDQRGEENRCRNHGCADQDRHCTDDDRALGGAALRLVFDMSFR